MTKRLQARGKGAGKMKGTNGNGASSDIKKNWPQYAYFVLMSAIGVTGAFVALSTRVSDSFSTISDKMVQLEANDQRQAAATLQARADLFTAIGMLRERTAVLEEQVKSLSRRIDAHENDDRQQRSKQ